MGTRNLTIVRSKKKTKVAQYGQWDGYPTGQGQTIADFLKTVDLAKFKKQIDALKAYTDKKVALIWEKGGADKSSGLISMDKAKIIENKYPELSRDQGAGILQLIHDGKVTKVQLSESFKDDKIWCEYWYEINLDDETVAMNGGKPYPFTKWTAKGLMKRLEK